jgi:endogenous inhibitor of DNA gyrase (YacG/DUF329 family)
MVDLGDWASEAYRIPVREQNPESPDAEGGVPPD